MSTNYYLRRKPSVDDINDLKRAIDSSVNGEHYNYIVSKVERMYGHNEYNDDNVIHIGKRATGWKFLWCANVRYETFIDFETGKPVKEIKKMYELTREGITDFIMQDEYVLVNEYDDILDKNEFLEMAFNWEVDGYDSLSNGLNNNNSFRFDETEHQKIFKELGYRFAADWQSDFNSDGLRFSTLDTFF